VILQDWKVKQTFYKIKHSFGPSNLKIVFVYFHFLMEPER